MLLACAALLGAQDPSWSEMLRLAALNDATSQQRAAAMFEQLSPQLAESAPAHLAKGLLPLLEKGLRSSGARERKNAASLLATIATIREDGAELLGGMTRLIASGLADGDESVQVSCAVALASQRPAPNPGAIEALRALAETHMKAGRVNSLLLVTAVSGLAECERCGNTEDVIVRALRSVAEPEAKRRMILAVGEGRSRHARVIEYFAQAVAQEEGKVRLAAVLAIGNYGPAAKAALPALTALLEKAEGDEELEQATGSALKRILSPEE